MKRFIATFALLALVGCATNTPSEPSAPTITAASVQNATAVISADVAQACEDSKPIIAEAQDIAQGGAANTVASTAVTLSKSCTAAGMAALTANDAAGLLTDGGSAQWVKTISQAALTAATVAAAASQN